MRRVPRAYILHMHASSTRHHRKLWATRQWYKLQAGFIHRYKSFLCETLAPKWGGGVYSGVGLYSELYSVRQRVAASRKLVKNSKLADPLHIRPWYVYQYKWSLVFFSTVTSLTPLHSVPTKVVLIGCQGQATLEQQQIWVCTVLLKLHTGGGIVQMLLWRRGKFARSTLHVLTRSITTPIFPRLRYLSISSMIYRIR